MTSIESRVQEMGMLRSMSGVTNRIHGGVRRSSTTARPSTTTRAARIVRLMLIGGGRRLVLPAGLTVASRIRSWDIES